MLYNSNSWSAPAIFLENLDITHRKHLRRILNIWWPKGSISNRELYKRCKTEKLSDRVCRFRWTMFGHILRSHIETPAFLSLKFAVTNNLKSRKGRHQNNLFNVLLTDLKSILNMELKTEENLNNIRAVAFDRKFWRDSFYKCKGD